MSSGEDEYEAYVVGHGLKLPPLKEILELEVGTVGAWNFNTSLGDTIMEKYESLYIKVVEMFSIIYRKSFKVGKGWICTSPEIASIFETATSGFNPAMVYKTSNDVDDTPTFMGTINFRWNLYSHINCPQYIIMGIGMGELVPESLARLRIINFVI